MSVRVVAFSDTHGKHEQIELPEGDILLHAGDFTTQGTLEQAEDFARFFLAQPHPHKVVIAGNHDICFEQEPEASQALFAEVHYLQDAGVEIEGLRIYGSPWQPCYHDWAFNLPRGQPLREKWEQIPEAVDILLTHGPPFGIGDQLHDGEQLGCHDLREIVFARKPQLHVFGHIHESAGAMRSQGIQFVNASSCTRRRKPIHPPFVCDLSPR